ncbi:hypothetical protein HY638_01325 [Candidatus Woesearchaeota archaeon]|nr:hypothetical protein [Candidatus Woesearchaeota archaeon]
MRNKGQVTLYIIMGLVLLIAVALVYYVRTLPEKEIAGEVKRADELPTQFLPVSDFVDACLARISTEAITKLGNRGGYIQPETYGITSVTADPTSGSAVQFSPRSSMNVPYWYFMKSGNGCRGSCEFIVQRPSLHASGKTDSSIETQISNYVSQNIERCTSNFEQFRAQAMDVEKTGDISAKTTVTENDIAIVLNYPLKITQDNSIGEVNEFSTRMALNLKRIYELGSLLTELEGQYRFLERDVLNLIVLFSEIDSKKLPPMAETEFKFGSGTSWTKSDVKDRIEGMLMSYIPMLKVTGTSNYEPFTAIGDELQEALYNVHSTVPLNKTFSDLEVRMTYLDFWPIYFDLNCDGEHCTSESVSSNLLALMGIQRYNFVYDVSFPVMVEIYDKNALRGQGYYFRYFLEGNIRNNEVLKSDFVPLEMVDPNPSSLLCRESSRNSGDVVVTVRENDKPLDGVEAMYSCAGETCYVGKTSKGALVAKFPICFGGILTLNKEGYLGRSEILSTEIGKSATVEAGMVKLSPVNVEIGKKKMSYTNGKWVFNSASSSLKDEEYGMITFRRKGTVLDDEVTATAEFGRGGNVSVQLAPGDYELEIRLFTDEDVVIPEDKRCEGALFTEKCYKIPKTEINETFPLGSVKINITITAEDLEKAKMTAYVLELGILDVPPDARKIEMLEQINKMEQYSAENEYELKPRFG